MKKYEISNVPKVMKVVFCTKALSFEEYGVDQWLWIIHERYSSWCTNELKSCLKIGLINSIVNDDRWHLHCKRVKYLSNVRNLYVLMVFIFVAYSILEYQFWKFS